MIIKMGEPIEFIPTKATIPTGYETNLYNLFCDIAIGAKNSRDTVPRKTFIEIGRRKGFPQDKCEQTLEIMLNGTDEQRCLQPVNFGDGIHYYYIYDTIVKISV